MKALVFSIPAFCRTFAPENKQKQLYQIKLKLKESMIKTISPQSTKRSYMKPNMKVHYLKSRHALLAGSYTEKLPADVENDIEFE